MKVLELNSSNFAQTIATGVTLVDFWAPWCGPCRMLAPTISELAEEMPDVKFGKLNVDEASDIAAKYEVMSIPMLLVLKDGEVVNSSVGVLPKAKIKANIEAAL